MLILAIDTALDACAAAILDTGTSQLIARESLAMKRGHAEALMPLIARVMKDAGLPFAALDRIAVTAGPGSFTGLRVGLSAARGIALAAGKPVVGLTTLSAYAAPVVSESGEQPVISAIDARHDHVYFQAVSGDGSALIAPQVAPIAEMLAAWRFGRAASGRQRRADSRRPLAGGCAAARRGSTRRPRPTSPGWRGWAPRSARAPRRPVRFTCARPTPNPQAMCRTALRRRPPHDRMALRTLDRWQARGRSRHAARCAAARRASRRLVPSRLG